MKILHGLAICVALTVSVGALAKAKDGERRHGPPPIAFEVCEQASESQACSFEGRRGEEVSGTCLTPRRTEVEDTLVCVPDRRPPKPRSQEEPE